MTTAQIRAIERHGQSLLAIFPEATERDPIELCRKLRRLEGQAAAFALRLCNGPEFASEEEQERIKQRILDRVDKLLRYTTTPVPHGDVVAFVPVFLNQDPRGYQLKIEDTWMQRHPEYSLHRDWGGYGILAPEIGKNG